MNARIVIIVLVLNDTSIGANEFAITFRKRVSTARYILAVTQCSKPYRSVKGESFENGGIRTLNE